KEKGFLVDAPGFYSSLRGEGRTSRIWPSEKLAALFKEAKFGSLDVDAHTGEECIILRDTTIKRIKTAKNEFEDYEVNQDVKYRDSDQTTYIRKQLKAYNELLSRTYIDIPILETSFIELRGAKAGSKKLLPITQRDKFVRRIFNRGSWNSGGRFWGGW